MEDQLHQSIAELQARYTNRVLQVLPPAQTPAAPVFTSRDTHQPTKQHRRTSCSKDCTLLESNSSSRASGLRSSSIATPLGSLTIIMSYRRLKCVKTRRLWQCRQSSFRQHTRCKLRDPPAIPRTWHVFDEQRPPPCWPCCAALCVLWAPCPSQRWPHETARRIHAQRLNPSRKCASRMSCQVVSHSSC